MTENAAILQMLHELGDRVEKIGDNQSITNERLKAIEVSTKQLETRVGQQNGRVDKLEMIYALLKDQVDDAALAANVRAEMLITKGQGKAIFAFILAVPSVIGSIVGLVAAKGF